MEQAITAQVPENRLVTSVFTGVTRFRRAIGGKQRAQSTGLAACENMTSEEYPCAMTRRPRAEIISYYRERVPRPEEEPPKYPCGYAPSAVADAAALGEKTAYLLTNGAVIYGEKLWNGAAAENGRIYPFGHGLYCPANDLYIPDALDGGSEPVTVSASAHWRVEYTDAEGTEYPASAQAPENPSEGDYWYKTGENAGLYRYDGAEWQAWPVYYTKLTAVDADTGQPISGRVALLLLLKKSDVLRIDCELVPLDIPFYAAVESVNSAGNSLIIKALLDPAANVEATLTRRVPLTDFAVVNKNRVWACRFGLNDEGEYVNEIYACKAGDPTNWFYMQGTEDDAVVISCGDEGPWTGAAVVSGRPVFFKERCMYTVYGDGPSDYRVVADQCAGIAKGSGRSAVNINGALYYLSAQGVMRLYAGTLPQLVSDEVWYKDAPRDGVAGTDGRKYYLQGGNRIFVLDTELREWHEEDALPDLTAFANFENELLGVCCAKKTGTDYYEVTKTFMTDFAPPTRYTDTPLWMYSEITGALVRPSFAVYNYDYDKIKETPLEWAFETGDFGLEAADYKRLKSLAVRAWMETGATLEIDIQYDGCGRWAALARSDTIDQGMIGTTRVETRLRRCDVYRLRLRGTGRVCVYGITHVYEEAGDRSYGSG